MEKFKKILNQIKSMLTKENKKLGESLVILVIIGVIIIIAGGSLFGGKKNQKDTEDISMQQKVETLGNVKNNDEKSELELKMEEILSQISGAGEVKVMVTYTSGIEIIPLTDVKRSDSNTDEQDSAGGTRKSVQSSFESSIVYEEVGGGVKKPIIVKELYPEVKGVVVVAEGAAEATVREGLLNAVRVLLDIPIHRIQVYEREK
ncbi:UNVERIFIED_CONTAM: stage III sporulation protein AG [Acetivibrio alkalicellulosi]